jgi:hypothetical protein
MAAYMVLSLFELIYRLITFAATYRLRLQSAGGPSQRSGYTENPAPAAKFQPLKFIDFGDFLRKPDFLTVDRLQKLSYLWISNIRGTFYRYKKLF